MFAAVAGEADLAGLRFPPSGTLTSPKAELSAPAAVADVFCDDWPGGSLMNDQKGRRAGSNLFSAEETRLLLAMLGLLLTVVVMLVVIRR
jgi:hypothetical protein